MNLKSINLSENKPHHQEYTLYNFVYVKLEKKTCYSIKNQINGARVGSGDWLQRGKKYILGVMKIFCILIVVVFV